MKTKLDVLSPVGTDFERVNLSDPRFFDEIVEISSEYFDWMNEEIIACCKFSIPDIVGMGLDDYVRYTTQIGSRIGPDEGGVYVRRSADGSVMAMCGLRRLPDGAAEIVRIFTRPTFRGQGLGAQAISHLVAEAGRLGYGTLKLDTGVFMTSAHAIYRAAGFSQCQPYEGAEPPHQLLPYWLYMERPL